SNVEIIHCCVWQRFALNHSMSIVFALCLLVDLATASLSPVFAQRRHPGRMQYTAGRQVRLQEKYRFTSIALPTKRGNTMHKHANLHANRLSQSVAAATNSLRSRQSVHKSLRTLLYGASGAALLGSSMMA